MVTLQTQIKINLPLLLKGFIERKAATFGMPMTAYIKHLILKDVEDMHMPIRQASEKTERLYRRAKTDYREGKTIHVNDADAFLDEL